MNIGDRVRAKITASDSFYKEVEGVVTRIKNGWVSISADMVIDKWSTDWEKHPTSCAMSAKIGNVREI